MSICSQIPALIASASFVARSKFDKDYWKYLLRALVSYRHSCAWALFVLSDSRLRQIATQDRSLLFRLQRPYLRKSLSTTDKIRCLVEHYQWMLDAWPSSFTGKLYEEGIAELATIPADDGRVYRIVLSPPGRNGKEGELVATLMLADMPLMLAAFTVHRHGDASAISIGCLQGYRDEGARDLLRQATRDMHGLRPRQALLVALYALAGHQGIRHLLGVPNDAHIYQERIRTRTRVCTDFDELWREMGGIRDGEHYLLPPVLQRRPIEAVPSHKRAQYRRRYALEQQLTVAIHDGLPYARHEPVAFLPHCT